MRTFSLAIFAILVAAHCGASGREGSSMPQTVESESQGDPGKGLIGARGVLPADFMLPAAGLFGLVSCDYAKSWYMQDRTYASLNVGTPSISCSVWPTQDRQQLAFAGMIDKGGVSIPVVGYASEEVMAGRAPRAMAVYMVGGPGGDIAPGLNDTLPAELVRHGYAVIKLGYSGTRYGSSYPQPDFDIAARQLATYLKWMAKAHPELRTVVIGESLGAQIAEHALVPDVARGLHGIALVHPLMFSPAAALQNFKERIGVSEATDVVMTITTNDGSKDKTGIRSISATTLSRFRSFFPLNKLNTDLADYIVGNAPVPTLLAYGTADTRIGADLITSIRARCPGVKVLPLNGVNHTIAAEEARAIVAALDELPGRTS